MAIVLWHEGRKALALTVNPSGDLMARQFRNAPDGSLQTLTGVDVPTGTYKIKVSEENFRRLGRQAVDETVKTSRSRGGAARSRSGSRSGPRSPIPSRQPPSRVPQLQQQKQQQIAQTAQAAGRQKAQAQDARQDAQQLRKLQKGAGQAAAKAQNVAQREQAQARRAKGRADRARRSTQQEGDMQRPFR